MGNDHIMPASLSLLLALCFRSLRGKVTEVGEFRRTDLPTSASPQAELAAGRKHTRQLAAFPRPQRSGSRLPLQQGLEGYGARVNLVTSMP